MWTNYSTRDAAEFVGLSESAIRSCVRSGVVASRGFRFSFQELVVLKIVRSLVSQGVSLPRVRRQLGALVQRNPSLALSSISLACHNGHVIVCDNDRAWRADSGQLVFEFELTPPADTARGELAAMPVRREAPAPEPIAALTADEWFERACELEEADPEGAIAAYERSLHLRPDCSETLINLGRLHAENDSAARAAECFKRALDLDPRDATALYNLGVVAQDAGKDTEAVQLYERSLGIDPSLAEAHYNLAAIFDRVGDPRAAIRHINEYRKLTRGGRTS